jgi:hypothetical protein
VALCGRFLPFYLLQMPSLFVFFFLLKNKEENLEENLFPRTLFWRLVSFSRGVKPHCHLSRDNFLEYKLGTLNLLSCALFGFR